jgi:polyphosphate kinase
MMSKVKEQERPQITQDAKPAQTAQKPGKAKLKRKAYEKEMAKLHIELVKLQRWVTHEGLRVVIVFEGRDAAGKGGTIKRITERVSPRIFRHVALPKPTEREKTEIYFQRYMAHFPAAGEVIIFDRSWYNRAGVEHVMGFCTDKQYEEFLKNTPAIEQLIIEQGIILIKYWLEVSEEEQDRRFKARIGDGRKVWKLSPMDIESHRHWYDYSRARDAMFDATDTVASPWYVVDANVKRRARLNCIAHLLSLIPYKDFPQEEIKLGKPHHRNGYKPPERAYHMVPEIY